MTRKPNDHLRMVIDAYTRQHQDILPNPLVDEGHYVEVDAERARKISAEYEKLPTVAGDWQTSAGYRFLLRELIDQWRILEGFGYKLLPWAEQGQPYADSREMRDDVRNNKRLYFFTGGDPHPYLNDVTETGFTGNEMLRAVHDCFGHAAEGYGFGARGEENAWIHHSMMFSPLAQKALTTETRGQNSWVNFGPASHLPASERPYAEQKVAILPEWCCDWRQALYG